MPSHAGGHDEPALRGGTPGRPCRQACGDAPAGAHEGSGPATAVARTPRAVSIGASCRPHEPCVRVSKSFFWRDVKEDSMIVNDVMSAMVCLIEPGQPIREAARLMAE